jgi:hypothetical protein
MLRTMVGLLIALALMLLVRLYVPAGAIRVDPGILGVFFTVFGLVYAIIIGFLLLDVLNRFNAISTAIQDELNAVERIRDFLIYVDNNEEAKAGIINALSTYMKSVIAREWPAMGQLLRRRHAELALYYRRRPELELLDPDTSQELYDVMRAVEKIKVIDESDGIALGAIIGKIGDATYYRTRRIELAQQSLPPTMEFLIVFMSMVLAIGFLLMDIKSIWVQSFMVISVNTAMHLLYMVVIDLDRPFEGLWSISSRPFARVLQRLEQLQA